MQEPTDVCIFNLPECGGKQEGQKQAEQLRLPKEREKISACAGNSCPLSEQ